MPIIICNNKIIIIWIHVNELPEQPKTTKEDLYRPIGTDHRLMARLDPWLISGIDREFYDPSRNWRFFQCRFSSVRRVCILLHQRVRRPETARGSQEVGGVRGTLTCTLLTDDHAQIDGGPLRLRGAAVGAAPVGLVEPDLLCHFVVAERLHDRFLDRFNPLLLLPLRLGREAATMDFFWFVFCPTSPNTCLTAIDLI